MGLGAEKTERKTDNSQISRKTNNVQKAQNTPKMQNKRPLPKNQTKKKPRTPEQLKREKEIKKAVLKRFSVILAIFLTCYIAVSLVIIGLVWKNYNKISPEYTYSVKVYQAKKNPESRTEKERLLASLDAEEANIGGGVYISFTALSKVADLSAVGDSEKFTAVFCDYGDTLECTPFSAVVYINNIPAYLEHPVLLKGTEYYIPIDFLQKYVIGLSVLKLDEDGGYYKIVPDVYGQKLTLRNHFDDGTDEVSEPAVSKPNVSE